MAQRLLVMTGASKGIGRQTAIRFVEAGWSVINLARTACADPRVTNIAVDLSSPEAVSLALVSLHRCIRNKQVICLLHNAAMHQKDSVVSARLSDLREALEVNVVAPIILGQSLIPKMAPGSSVLFMGSTLSEKAVRNAASYVISKHAVAGMMRAVCQDLAGTGIHTACICPGFTETEMLCGHLEGAYDKATAMSCFGRLIQPSEIADCILFAANSPVLNGATLHANLGQIER